MIRGIVTPGPTPVVTIDVENGSGGFQSLDFIVDPGFSDELVIPSDLIQRLSPLCRPDAGYIG